jgi:hypothetical protein
MAAIGWTAFGTLCTKVLVESSTLSEVLNYTTVAIGVCASCSALIAVSSRVAQAILGLDPILQQQVATLKLMADQTPFAESRARLLSVAQRIEKHDSQR